MSDLVPLSDLALAAFCPRQLYYARRGDRTPPPAAAAARELAHSYPALLVASDAAIRTHDVALEPAAYREALASTRDRVPDWDALVDPPETDVLLEGREVIGRLDKVIDDPLAPVLVSPGTPPETGVWRPQSVRAVGAAAALAWREGSAVETAFVEYPRHGVIRRLSIGTRRRAAYRRTLRTVQEMAGPPPRRRDRERCESCEYAAECGVRTRSLRSLLAQR
ncbi:MAG: hypothetical protein ABEJ77_05255 [Halanaeroarchaeum sp.]